MGTAQSFLERIARYRWMWPVAFVAMVVMAAPIAAQNVDPRVRWLQKHAVPVNTLELEGRSDPGLATLRQAVGDRRIVLLGEQSHGDGATFRAKSRIIRYMHQKMGFDLLVFESAFYGCRRTWVDAQAGLSLADSASACLFPLWANAAELQPLLTYLDANKHGEHPLELAGMDFQPSGTRGRFFVDDLAAFLRAQPDTVGIGRQLQTVKETYGKLFTTPREFRSLPDSSREALRRTATALAARPLMDVPRLGKLGEAWFWKRALESQLTFAEFAWALDPAAPDPQTFNLRDAAMAENLAAIARQNPDRRIMVWGASSHLIRNRQGIEGDPAPNMVPAGQLISGMLPGDVYSVAFLGATGEFGIARPGAPSPPRSVPAPPEGSVEDLWLRTRQELAFLNLSDRPDGSWLGEQQTARPLGYAPMMAVWPRHFDAFFLIRSMTPATAIP